MAYRLSDSLRRAGQYMGLIETPPNIQQDESRVKRVLGKGGSRKVFISSIAAAYKEIWQYFPQSIPDSPAVNPPIRCLARSSGVSFNRNERISSTSAHPRVYSVATWSINRRLASWLACKASQSKSIT